MNRLTFTKEICKLILQMIYEGENPIMDWLLRTAEVQNVLYQKGQSKCDGYINKSAHQFGKAIDIYFPDIDDVDKDQNKDELISPKKGFEYWHEQWELRGGKPMIEWDGGHFEG